MDFTELQPLLERAIALRQAADQDMRVTINDPKHESAFRLFNGFSEGAPDFVADIYARTLVIHDYAGDPGHGKALIDDAATFLRQTLQWLRAGIQKTRKGASQDEKRGKLIFGDSPDTKIREQGVWYAIPLTMNRDASFYIDTRNLRKWLIENMRGKSVLNTFAYTGSLGVAALAGGASQVVQLDQYRKFLEVARASCTLNGFAVDNVIFRAQDFFPAISSFKNAKQLFDCVILDPPFFSSTEKGTVDQLNESARLINKVRPLIKDGGWLVAVNNALYVSGRGYMQTLEELSRDGYLRVEKLIDVPGDFVGLNLVGRPMVDPAPFNHATKVAVLEVRRKQTHS